MKSAPRVVCFYENWARYRPPLGRFLPTNIPPHLCTHIHYVGAGVHAETLRVGPLDVFADLVTGGYRSTVELREHNPDLKVLPMIGGSGQQQDSLRAAAATAESRKQLAEAAVEFLREHDFDGLDVDWKPPHAPEDHAGLLEALRAAFDRDTTSTGRRRLLLAVELTPHPDELREHFDMERVTAAVDYANVLGYRYQDVGPYAAGEDQIVAFDDETSLQMKARMAREAGLGGVAAWTVSLDDFRGFCTGEPFSYDPRSQGWHVGYRRGRPADNTNAAYHSRLRRQ
ncbi:Endochitinase [Amphibalanus amphitrite]|uniref:Endochitinase n=1 Tax=Amphibalanus amphitrite TaxID=1232801 RepID=A0A6A4V9U4_AMPAM|nr:Endochitinase [Amphibalanus amphitrite]